MNFNMITHKRLSGDELSFVMNNLEQINSIIRKWQDKLELIHKQAKQAIFASCVEQIPVDMQEEFLCDSRMVSNLRNNSEVLGGRNIDDAVLQSFAATAVNFAHKWNKNPDSGLEFEDLIQECYMKIYEAMYQWSPQGGGNLTTLFYMALERHMTNVLCRQGSFFSPLGEKAMKLLGLYGKAQKAADGELDQNEIIASMELSKEDESHLRDILVRPVNASVAVSKANVSEDHEQDYSTLAKTSDSISENEALVQRMYVSEILDKSDLNDLERKIIEVAMEPYHGWQTEISKEVVNPETCKPMSRARIGQILDEAKRKVGLTIRQLN